MDDNTYDFDLAKAPQTIIKVIGVGGGGGNAVSNMYREGIRDVSFVLCNTDNQDRSDLAEQIGPVRRRPEIRIYQCKRDQQHDQADGYGDDLAHAAHGKQPLQRIFLFCLIHDHLSKLYFIGPVCFQTEWHNA